MKTRSKALLAALIVLGFAGVWRLQLAIDTERALAIRESDELLLTSPRMLKLLSFEFAPLLGQIYWTRAVQYYGEQHAGPARDFTTLWPLLDIATTLDPNLLPAYRFGSMFLSAPAPGGAGRPDQAVTLLQRGIQENPEYWRFYQDLGFIYYMDAKDYPKAAQAFEEGSRKPGAKLWMRAMAAKVAAEGESFETSMFLWRDVYQTAIDPDTKKGALTHLQLLRARQDCKQLDSLDEAYAKRFGHPPGDLNQLVQSGMLNATPVDPLGFAYLLDAQGKAQLNPRSPLVEKQKLLEPVR
jgi:tetratricopeptide (TPR) repeat protein